MLLTLISVTSMHSLSAQVGSPFDLAPRLDTTKVVIPATQLPPSRVTVQPKAPSKRNPFDLARGGDDVMSAPVAPAIEFPVLPGVGESLEAIESRGTFDTILCFSLLVFLALATVLRGGSLRKIFSAALNSNLLSQVQREQRKFGYYLWASLGIIVLGCFFFVASRQLYPRLMHYSWPTLAWFVLGALGLTGFKLLVLGLLSAIFPLGKTVTTYQTLILVYAGLIGICLLPAVVLICFGTSGLGTFVAYLSLGAVGVGYTVRSLRALIDSSRIWTRYPLHFLLYLCALEIGPLAVALKLLTA